MRRTRLALSVGLALIAGAAAAQQLYRWTDEKGRVHVTDTPPPPTARDVQKKKGGSGSGTDSGTDSAQGSGAMPYELAQAVKDFPVMLYTSPSCGQACVSARGALNKRSVPFKEMQVWDEKSNEELKRVSGGTDVPTLLVGRSVQKGFEQGAYDALLDSARYPKSGLLPPRTQAAPAPPEGYVPPSGEAPKAEPAKPETEAPKAATGPYAPGAPPQRPQKK